MNANKVVMKVVSISATVLIILLVIFGIFKLGQYAYHFGYRVYAEEAVDQAPGKDVLVHISEKMSQDDMASLFENKGLIRDRRLFTVQLKLTLGEEYIQEGAYTLNTSMTAQEMIDVLKNAENTDDEDTPTGNSDSMVDVEGTGE